jgi:hypothetical protein
MLINFAWPRAASNPTPDQTGNLLDFGWSWLNGQPVLWTVTIAIAGIGTAYYVLVQRHKRSEVADAAPATAL